MSLPKLSKFHKLAIIWLSIFTVVCLINAMLVIVFELYGGEDYAFAIALPFWHFGGLICLSFICTMFFRKGEEDSRYIEKSYPEIWNKLHPFGKRMYFNTFGNINFIRGKYDNGTDEKLSCIKSRRKWEFYLILGAVFSMLLSIFVSIGLIYIKEVILKKSI